jgi:hypothetical protein
MVDRPEARYVHSRVPVAREGEVIVGASFSGGGAGDTTYEVLACQKGREECEVLAAIGDNGLPKPEVSLEDGRIMITLSKEHGITGFKNYTRLFSNTGAGSIRLKYRD